MHMPEIQSVLNEKNISATISGNTLTRRTRSAWRRIYGMRDGMKRSKEIMTACLRSI